MVADGTLLLIVAVQPSVLDGAVAVLLPSVLVFGHTEDVQPAVAIVHVQLLQTIDIVSQPSHGAAVEA